MAAAASGDGAREPSNGKSVRPNRCRFVQLFIRQMLGAVGTGWRAEMPGGKWAGEIWVGSTRAEQSQRERNKQNEKERPSSSITKKGKRKNKGFLKFTFFLENWRPHRGVAEIKSRSC